MKKSKIKRSSAAMWIIFGFLMIYAISLIFLYLWAFYTSLKSAGDFLKDMIFPPLPWKLNFVNYKTALDLFQQTIVKSDGVYKLGIYDMLYNSIVFCLLRTTIGTFVQWLMAYLIAHFKWRFTDFFYKLMIVIMMIPVMGTLPATLAFWKGLNLYDTWTYVAISSIGFGGFNFLIFYSFIRNVANDTIEAAKIDGAGNFSLMMRIVFPQTLNAFLILYVTTFIANWNDYMTMVIMLPSYPSLAYGVYSFSVSSATGAGLPPIQMAGSMLLVLPIFIVFMIFKEKILGGISVSLSKI
ncbi:MAG: carbohydrate ABC transporter permease [Clostridia bacterium]|nr:carbohydrate ABC transporter permease [Clostridia bacterium]